MKITVINGTEKHGVTWRLKEIFLERFREKAEITEFYLPEDCPCFCMGCAGCIFKGEHICKDFSYIRKIAEPLLESDLIVMTSPAYVMHATGAMKALLDHFAYLWMPHRPAPEMFSKRAVIITQCLGAGARSAAADIKHSLSWWGISQITVFTGKLMSDIVWEKLAGKKRAELTGRMNRLSKKLAAEDFGKTPGVSAVTKIKFLFCRMMQKSLHENDPEYTDGKYWAQQGWLSGKRPW
ncbi:MAG: flavodoxin family protein [Lachnospiraceae bacterium]|mgnify:FL=1|jgi:Multimeric flavodoxin WrbA|nr:flavodoxin family protein [Lachnospiraceae bacterium]